MPNTQNLEKKDTPLKNWVEQNFENSDGMYHYLSHHHLSGNISLDFKDFKQFVKEREANIKRALIEILNVKSVDPGQDLFEEIFFN